jgi:uncharacterized protein YcnI
VKKTKTLAAATLAASFVASAHVVLDQPSAAAGSSYRAVFRVGHGCDGLATTAISVRLPPGVQGAKPMPKPGWTLSLRSEPLAQPYVSHGKKIEADVSEVTWTVASPEAALPDAQYDEFVLRAGLPTVAGPLWFKVVQSRGAGGESVRKEWTQVPASGTSTRGLPTPAALLLVEPAAMAAPASAPHH